MHTWQISIDNLDVLDYFSINQSLIFYFDSDTVY